MTGQMSVRRAAVPWQFWAISGLSLLWNAFGAYDYTMTNLRDANYLKMFPPELMAWIDGFPVWATACWALGVWGSLAGSVLLLLRSRHAVPAFMVSLAGAVVSMGYQYFASGMPAALNTPGMQGMAVFIVAVVALLWRYARKQAAAGVLR